MNFFPLSFVKVLCEYSVMHHISALDLGSGGMISLNSPSLLLWALVRREDWKKDVQTIRARQEACECPAICAHKRGGGCEGKNRLWLHAIWSVSVRAELHPEG